MILIRDEEMEALQFCDLLVITPLSSDHCIVPMIQHIYADGPEDKFQ